MSNSIIVVPVFLLGIFGISLSSTNNSSKVNYHFPIGRRSKFFFKIKLKHLKLYQIY